MASPNTLIINNKTVIDASYNFFGTSMVLTGNLTLGGSTTISPNSISTTTMTITGALNVGSITAGAGLNLSGAVSAGSFSTTGTFSAGVTTFNSTVTLGNILLQNGQAKVGNSQVNTDSFVGPYASITNVNVPGTVSAGTVSAALFNSNGDHWFYGGTNYMTNSRPIMWRNPANTANILQMNVDGNGLWYMNGYNNDGTFKATLFRWSVGAGTSDQSLSIGVSTVVNGNFNVTAALGVSGGANISGSLGIGGNLQVNGSINSSAAVTMNNYEARGDSRVTRAVQGDAGQGMLYFGNSDKRIHWDGGNWVIRGGSLYASAMVSDSNFTAALDVTVGRNLQVNNSVNINSTLTAAGQATLNGNLRVNSSMRLVGYGNGGLLYFGDGDNYLYYNSGFQFNGGNVSMSNDLYAVNVYARGGSMITHHNNAAGTIYFGNGLNSYIDYNGAGQLAVPHDFRTAGSFHAAGNLNASGNANFNGGYGNYLHSNGNMDCNGDMNSNRVITNYILNRGDSDMQGETRLNVLKAGECFLRGNVGIGGATFYGNGGNQAGAYIVWDGSRMYTNSAWAAAGDISTPNSCVGGVGRFGQNGQVAIYVDGAGSGVIDCPNSQIVFQAVFGFGFNQRSDVRLKDIRKDFLSDSDCLSKVMDLEPIAYTWKNEVNTCSQTVEYGFKAQQVEEIFPDLVQTSKDEMETKNIKAFGMMPILTSSIRELKRELDELRAELAAFKKAPKKRA